MGTPLRTFVALRCGDAARRALRREADRLARVDPAFRLAGGGDFHLTLQFLGDTREEDVPGIGRALLAAARASRPVEVAYGPLGAFPEPSRARVVWVGVAEEPAGTLTALARDLGARLRDLGYPPEARAFAAHVTLGRLKGRPSADLVQAVERSAGKVFATEGLSEAKFILSRPEEGRYHYIDLTTAALGTGSADRA